MRFVPVKSPDQQDLQSLHRVRDRIVGARTALINHKRALLGEYCVILPKGAWRFLTQAHDALPRPRFLILPVIGTGVAGSVEFAAGLTTSHGGTEVEGDQEVMRNFPINRLAAQDRESDTRHLLGKRYGDKLERLLLDQLLAHIRSGSV
jgi:hypothetical protein